MGIAARWTKWLERGSPVAVGVPGSGALSGVPILTQQFGTALHLAVQIAWGADLTQPDTAWVWTDVTPDVQYAEKITITIGGTDQAATPQPAQCTFTLDNRAGLYSKGGQSGNYPNVKRGVPVRVMLLASNGAVSTRFEGYVAEFAPTWDTTGRYAVVSVTAAGIKRRLQQQKKPVASEMTRNLPIQPNVIAYWPCEEGVNSTSFASAVRHGRAMQITGPANLASYSGFAATNPIPTFATDSWTGLVGAYTDTGNAWLAFLLNTPTAGMPDQTRIVTIYTNGTVARIELRYAGTPAAGGFRLLAFDQLNNTLFDSGNLIFGIAPFYYVIQWTSSGGNITFAVNALNYISGTTGGVTGTPFAGSITKVGRVVFAPDKNLTGVSVGQVHLRNSATGLQLISILQGYVGEFTGNRLDRLALENGEFLTRTPLTTHQFMGAQVADTFLNLMEGCAAVEQGLLYDGLTQGLAFRAFVQKLNQAASMTLDASIGQVEDPITPADDDRFILNQYTAARTKGSSATYANTTGDLSLTAAGVYDGSTTLNFAQDGQQLLDHASWKVHVGTDNQDVIGYRYPQLVVKLHHHPELLFPWANTPLWGRIDVTHLSSVRTQQNDATFSVLLEGYTEVIDQFTYVVTMNDTPYEPYRVGTLAAATGDTGENVMHLQTQGSTVVSGCDAGGASITVAGSGSEPLWTTVADDFPLSLAIGGNYITCTNITGASSPQTFTLDPTTVKHPIPAGRPVRVWSTCTPGVLEMG